jgi:hypothetical protein
MAFSFGNIRQSQRPNQIKDKIEIVLADCIKSDGYLLVTVDRKPTEAELKILLRDIEKHTDDNYIVVSAINEAKFDKKSVEDLLTVESTWRRFLKRGDMKARCVVALGNAFYCATQCSDTLYYQYINDTHNSTRVFLSQEFVKCGDLWYYPTYSISEIYPLDMGPEYVNFKTRSFWKQLSKSKNDDLDPSKFIDMRPYTIVDVTTPEQAESVLKSLLNSEKLSVDLETTGLDFTVNKIGCITLCNDGVTGYFIPWEFIDEKPSNRRLCLSMFKTAKVLSGANFKFDTKFLWAAKIGERSWVPTDDTMILSQAINSDIPKGLKPNAFRCTYFGGYDNQLDKVKKSLEIDNYMHIPHDVLVKYSTIDAIAAWRVLEYMVNQARWIDKKFVNDKNPDWGVERWYRDVMIPFYQDTIDLEYLGFNVNAEQREICEKDLKDRVASYRKTLVDLWNPILEKIDKSLLITDETNISSQLQLGKRLKAMGWPNVSPSDTGGFGTDDVAQIEWKRLGLPGVDELAKFRSLSTGLGAFVGYVDDKNKKYGWLQFMRDRSGKGIDWRMHPNFNVMGTKSYRCSVHEPSTQNLPNYDVLGKVAKKVLCPDLPMTPNFTVTDDTGKIWEGRGSDFVITTRGEIRFCELIETDEILDYGRRTPYITTTKTA